MTMLIILCALLFVMAAGALAVPLLKRAAPATGGAADIAVYESQLREVARDRARGVLDAAGAREASLEIRRRMLAADAAARPSAASGGEPAVSGIAVAAALVALLLATLVYLLTGRPDLPDRPLALARAEQAEQAAQDGAADAVTPEMIRDMVARLAARLADDPDDTEGLLRLARAYTVLGQREQALAAYDHLLARQGEQAVLLLLKARALREFAGGGPTSESMALVTRALALEPDNIEALWFSGLTALQAGERAEAVALFDRARSTLPAGSRERGILDGMIDRALEAADNSGVTGNGER